MEIFVKCFDELVRTVKENPKESLEVAAALALVMGGYGKGYCDGRRENDAIYQKLLPAMNHAEK